jgi:TetR/AcrR family transcriptional regulator, cholesterol catabolism regulator
LCLEKINRVEIKDRIVSGAKELFFRYGVKSITMDEVAKNLGISKKTIYQFFEDKDELVYIVAKAHMAETEAVMKNITEIATDPIDEVLKISQHLRQMFQNINPSLLFEIQKYHTKAWKAFTEHKEKCIHSSLTQNLKSGIEKGLYRSEIDVEILSRLRLEEIQMSFNPFIFPTPKFNIQKVQLQFIEHFLYGICTLKGHKLINKYKQIKEED